MDLLRIAARIADSPAPNPFPSSKIDHPVYHGSRAKGVKKFRRPDNGLWFAGAEGWVDDLYTGRERQGEVRTFWIDVRNPYTPTDDEVDRYYGNMDLISKDGFFSRLEAEGYDAYLQGGESDSIAVFTRTPVADFTTGELA